MTVVTRKEPGILKCLGQSKHSWRSSSTRYDMRFELWFLKHRLCLSGGPEEEGDIGKLECGAASIPAPVCVQTAWEGIFLRAGPGCHSI